MFEQRPDTDVKVQTGSSGHLEEKIKLWDIYAHITYHLYSGYLIDATTVTKCLCTLRLPCQVPGREQHVSHLPVVVHQSHPLYTLLIHDRNMHGIVYKIVPGFQEVEMRER